LKIFKVTTSGKPFEHFTISRPTDRVKRMIKQQMSLRTCSKVV